MHVEAPSLKALGGIRHAFFTREGGVSQGIYASLNGGLGSNDDQDHVRENRARMAQSLGLAPDRLVSTYQVHGTDVMIATTPWARAETPRCDAIVTSTPGLAICAASADCGPILFADREARVVGSAHSGWRGALDGVLEATVKAMEGLGASRANIVAALGPMISRAAYEVGPEFVAKFTDADAGHSRFFSPSEREGHAMFDLPAFITMRAAEAGIGFEDLALCTYGDEKRFFSYRRTTHRGEPDYGRHLSAISIEA